MGRENYCLRTMGKKKWQESASAELRHSCGMWHKNNNKKKERGRARRAFHERTPTFYYSEHRRRRRPLTCRPRLPPPPLFKSFPSLPFPLSSLSSSVLTGEHLFRRPSFTDMVGSGVQERPRLFLPHKQTKKWRPGPGKGRRTRLSGSDCWRYRQRH